MASAGHCPAFPFSRTETYKPAPENAELREHEPVSQVELYDGTKAWLVTRHKDICDTLTVDSVKLSADRRHPGYPEVHPGGLKAKEARATFVNLDNPYHDTQRKMLEDEFSAAAVEKLRPMMQETVDKVLKSFLERAKSSQPVDLIEHFAASIPTQITFKFLGVPAEDVERLADDSEIRHSTSRNAAETSNKNLQDAMHDLVEKRIQTPGNDIISKLITEQLNQGHLDKEDVATLAFLILTAGNAALLNTIGLGVITLLEHPDQLAELRKDPSLAPAVVNELLRYNTASALNSRRATKQDLTICGTHIPKDTGVICAVQAGDRDRLSPDEPDPETFNIRRNRDPAKVLGFGYGPHRCLAETFSRVQLEIVFATLVQRVPGLRLAKGVEELEYSPKNQNVGVVAVPVYV